MSVSEDKALFAECKWRNEKVDVEVIHTLIERGELFYYSEKHYYIFSSKNAKAGIIPIISVHLPANGLRL